MQDLLPLSEEQIAPYGTYIEHEAHSYHALSVYLGNQDDTHTHILPIFRRLLCSLILIFQLLLRCQNLLTKKDKKKKKTTNFKHETGGGKRKMLHTNNE